MRTKTLLLTAALAAAGLTSSMAQVFSVNAVGFVNVTVPANSFALLANPLNQPTNDLASVLADAPANTVVFDYIGGTFVSYVKRASGAWTGTGADTARLDPGEGFFIQNAGTAPMTLTFIGEVPQGNLSTPIAAGFNLIASKVPQSGKLETDLKLVGAANDVAYIFNPAAAGGYTAHTRRASGAWTPDEPTVDVARGFWLNSVAAKSWTRTFSVNN